MFPFEGPDRPDRVRFTPVGNLEIRHRHLRPALNGQPRHFETVLGRKNPSTVFVGRPTGWNQKNAVQSDCFSDFLGNRKMPLVNRIEGPPENADFHSRSIAVWTAWVKLDFYIPETI